MISIPLSTRFFEEYADHLVQNRRADTTIYRNRRILSRFECWAREQGVEVDGVSPMQMNQYINTTLREPHLGHPALSSVSCHGHLVCIRAAFQWALDVDMVEGKNPCRRVKVDVRRKPVRFFTNAELRSILAACVTDREYLASTVLMLSGLRLHELAALRWEPATGKDRRGETLQLPWADLTDRILHVVGKGEQPRRVPIHSVLIPLLANARCHTDSPYVLGNLSGGALWTSGVLEIIARPMRRVGLKVSGVGGHAYRRALNDTLRKNARGRDLERRLIIGHSIEGDINASRYSTVTISELADVVNQAYVDDPILACIPRLDARH